MSAWNPAAFPGRHIVVADEDPKVVAFVMKTLREDGHAVFHAYDVLAAAQLAFALEPCHLVISNTKVEGADGVELIQYRRKRRPDLPIIYLANIGRSTPEAEAQLPADVCRGGTVGWERERLGSLGRRLIAAVEQLPKPCC